MIRLNPRSKTPLYEQIYEQVLQGILEGVYPPGTKLASIRALADTLHCSRNTIGAAYRILIQEGYVYSKPGSGYVVADDELNQRRFSNSMFGSEHQARGTNPIVPQEGMAEGKGLQSLTPALYDFTYGNLQKGTFPALEWKTLTDDVLLSVDSTKADAYNDSEGETRLRVEIARSLAATRGIRCNPEQVIVQSGTQASLQNLLVLFDPTQDAIAMEDPGYDGARSVFERNHYRVVPCPVYGEKETFIDAFETSGARLAYTTPSNQFPLGLVMAKETRFRLIEWAFSNDAYIIEDDYCYEFNYRTQPLPALQTLDTRERVVYMGTFSKSLSPALRVNYLVLPYPLLERWKDVFSNAYPAAPWLIQEVLARYLGDNYRERHLRRVQLRARRKYELLTDALHRTMGDLVTVIENGAGLHLLVDVKDGRSQAELIAAAREVGVRVYGTDRYWATEEHPLNSCILIGFSAIDEQDIVPGVEALARAWFG